jgi:hypothetical protein
MSKTLIIQSQRSPLPYPWLSPCLDSVRHWAESHRYAYRFLNDELFDNVQDDLWDKLAHQKVIASDLARLKVLQQALGEGYETVVWLDADFLIFDPLGFVLPEETYSVGREVWVQHDRQGRLKVYKKVHNAFLMFRQGNGFLDFYTETAERLLRAHRGGMPPQYIGPKLLTAVHNICQLPVMETAGMLSPLVIKDLIQGRGDALSHFVEHSPAPIAGANLCLSSQERQEVSKTEMAQVISLLCGKENRVRPYFTIKKQTLIGQVQKRRRPGSGS